MSDNKHAVSHRRSDTSWNSCSTLGCFVFSTKPPDFPTLSVTRLSSFELPSQSGPTVFEITFIQITATALRLLRVPTSNPRLPFLPSHGCRSYLSNPCVWSSSQFRVTLRSHAWVESNLLWWKDKETLIEILPSGHLVLWFHMGLDKLFSSRAAVHIVFDPSLQQSTSTGPAYLSPHGVCDTAKMGVTLLPYWCQNQICTFTAISLKRANHNSRKSP